MLLSLVIPSSRGAAPEAIDLVAEYLAGFFTAFEIIVVEDGPLPRRGIISSPAAKVVSCAKNRGKGHAVRLGLSLARGDVVVFTDDDFPYGLEGIVAIYRLIAEGGWHCAAGDRRHPEAVDASPHRSYFRRALSDAAVFLARSVLGLRVRDPQCGLKGFSRKLVDAMLPELNLNRFGFDLEIFHLISVAGLEPAFIPVRMRPTDGQSTVRLLDAWRSLWELVSIRFRAYDFSALRELPTRNPSVSHTAEHLPRPIVA